LLKKIEKIKITHKFLMTNSHLKTTKSFNKPRQTKFSLKDESVILMSQ